MKITALLNPQLEVHQIHRASAAPHQKTPERPHHASSMTEPAPKPKSRDAKDAPKFDPGEPVGNVRFPPFQAETLEVKRQNEAFEIFPAGSINAFPRHIPYKSDKKEFLIKTGRDSFEGQSLHFSSRHVASC